LLVCLALALGLSVSVSSAAAQTPAQARAIRQLQREVGAERKQIKKQAAQIAALKKSAGGKKNAGAKKETLTHRDAVILGLFSAVLLVPLLLMFIDIVAGGRRLKRLTKEQPTSFRAKDLKEIAGGTPGLARYSMAALIFLILGWIVAYLFISGTNVDVAKSIATALTGLLASIVGFYFGAKSKEEAAKAATPPAKELTVIRTIPVDEATGVSRSAAVHAFFSQSLDKKSVTDKSFVLLDPSGQAVEAKVTNDAATWSVTLTPKDELGANAEYTARLSTAIKSETGIALAHPHSWRFKTGAT
jgi:hypothetical protein